MQLEVESLRGGYGRLEVLHGISLGVRGSECIALYGPNGHGKTTLLRTISGLLRVFGGDIRADGRSLVGRGARQIVELGIVHVPQGSPVFPSLTVREALLLGAYPRRAWGRRFESEKGVYELFPRLAERARQQVSTLSGGERQMLAIGLGLMARPEVLMLDEPTLGLAPVRREEVARAIKDIVQGGVTTVLVDQDLDLLFEVADRLYAVERGVVAKTTDRGEILSRDALLALYFGSEAG